MEAGVSSGLSKGIYRKGVGIILLMGLATAILQGNYWTSPEDPISAQIIRVVIAVIGIVGIALFASRHMNGKLGEEESILYIIFGGMLTRTAYVLFTDIWTLQNDGGTFTGFGTTQINNGHIGYVEYIYKFFHIPDMDPYEYFGYYHPPLHHIIEAIWMTIQRLIGVPEALAFENLQVPTLIYSGLCMIVMLHILEESGVSKKLMSAGMLLFAFHPRMMVLAGSVNNDILALLLLLATIWRTLCWIREKNIKNIVLIALALGFGMISKLNTAICAFSIALIFVIVLVDVIKKQNLVTIKNMLLQFVVFGAVCIPIGLSYIVRNLIRFGEKPGIPSPAIIPNESVMYYGDYSAWSIVGIPTLADLHVDFPFHPISAKVIHNVWVILFQTGLFAEAYPASLDGFPLTFAQVAYVASIILAIITTIVFIVAFTVRVVRNSEGQELQDLFLLSTYVFMLVSFSLYVFKYPYTCSGDFRYMTASLVFTSLGFVILQEKGLQQIGRQQAGMQQAGLPQTGMQQAGLPQTGMQQAGLQQTGMQQASLQQTGTSEGGTEETAPSSKGFFPVFLRFLSGTLMAATLICSIIVYMNWEI